VTSTAEPLIPGPPPLPSRPSVYDRWRGHIAADPQLQRLLRWLVPTVITLIAGILRFTNLGHPDALVFDETYYVKDSWSQWNLGYPASWPEGADARFVAGETDIFTTTGSFVVHPPLGKLLIGAGMALFGADSSMGWRFATAVFGTALVLLVYLIAKSLTGSMPFAAVAGTLMAVDGLAIVLSRVALLDVFLAFFVLLAFWFVVLDRRRHTARLSAAMAARGGPEPLGPVFWNRPWLIAAGAALGAATAVKWSGVYVIAAVGLYVVVSDALARRRAGVGLWPVDAIRQGLVAFVQLVPIAFVVYLASWTGWLTTDGGYDRHALDPGGVVTGAATGFWSWVPLPLQNLWVYHQAMYGFHVGLTSPHAYASPAWQWPLLMRPTSMYYHQDALGEAGCGVANGCVQNVYSMPNPLIWWAGAAAVVYLLVRLVMRRDWRHAVVLTGIAATYVPWLLYPDRTIFEFYTIAILPFLVLALTFALRDVAGGSGATIERRVTGQRLVWVFLVVALALSAFWYPVLTAMPVPYDFWRAHNWLPTWI
jgi:dolichyl-phosphate-mannose-protein mannosyltransferase